MRRVYSVVIYFQDSPSPLYLDDVWHIQTEGGLLRMIVGGTSQWWPLCNIATVRETARENKAVAPDPAPPADFHVCAQSGAVVAVE